MKLTSIIKNQLWEFKDRRAGVNYAIERCGRRRITVIAKDAESKAVIDRDELETVTEVKSFILVISNKRRSK